MCNKLGVNYYIIIHKNTTMAKKIPARPKLTRSSSMDNTVN